VLFTLAIGGWLLSGMETGFLNTSTESDATKAAPAPAEAEPDALFRVRVRVFSSQPKPAQIVVRGRTEAWRRVEVRTRTPGIVEKVSKDEGQKVAKGELLCQLDVGTRMTELAEERAKLASAEIDFQAADKLAEQKFGSKTKRASERAKLDAARASVERMRQEIGYTSIAAPITGILEKRVAELGSFLQVGGQCATIVDLDPMLVVVPVGERDIAAVRTGMTATAELVTGQTVEGTVSLIAPAADEATRTFRVEVEVPNPDLALREGVTSEIRLMLPSTPAHTLPSSVLTLNDKGQIGVRLIKDGNKVSFQPVKILDDDREGIWVGGLPDKATIITVGQDYVLDGQTVEPVFETAEAAQ
ncbi:MAG: efflux RND transporter periplasmic adaptor subunit, partial [Hyphomicrobiales bacterium]